MWPLCHERTGHDQNVPSHRVNPKSQLGEMWASSSWTLDRFVRWPYYSLFHFILLIFSFIPKAARLPRVCALFVRHPVSVAGRWVHHRKFHKWDEVKKLDPDRSANLSCAKAGQQAQPEWVILCDSSHENNQNFFFGQLVVHHMSTHMCFKWKGSRWISITRARVGVRKSACTQHALLCAYHPSIH